MQRSHCPSPTLTSLPAELLTSIALHLDRKSALSLALVARSLVSPAEHRIWRDLDIFLNPHHGELALVQPYPRSGSDPHLSWAKKEAREAEDRHRLALKERVRQIIVRGGEKRLGMVEKVRLISRPVAVQPIVTLLDFVSGTMKRLELAAPAHHVFAKEWRPTDYQTLEVQLIDRSLHFPSLTHLVVEKGAARFPEILPFICDSAPNLLSLQVNIDSGIEPQNWCDETLPQIPISKDKEHPSYHPTSLRSIAVTFGDLDMEAEDHPIYEIIDNSPALLQLSVCYTGDDPDMEPSLMLVIARLKGLVDLHWSLTPEQFLTYVDGADKEDSFPALRRLVLEDSGESLDSDAYLDLFQHTPSLPKLETIFIDRGAARGLKIPNPATFTDPSPTSYMIPAFAEALLGSPHLHKISLITGYRIRRAGYDIFSRIDAIPASKCTGFVRSIRHATEELIHARIFMHFYEISDTAVEPDGASTTLGPKSWMIDYRDQKGQERRKVFDWHREAAWHDIIYYKGLPVPMEIMYQMRRTQGAKPEAWTGRGIQVGAGAWKVLTDWAKSQKKEEAAVGEAVAGIFEEADSGEPIIIQDD